MPIELTHEQRAAVEWAGGPLMVLAGAGTGKTTVIVERVRWLLATEPELQPENVLVLTYNVRAASELTGRLEAVLGPDVASRLIVTNFHSFGHRIVSAHRAELGLPDRLEVLDEIGQLIFLRSLRPRFELRYHRLDRNLTGTLGAFRAFINRAKDELVTPAEFAAYVDRRRSALEAEFGAGEYEAAIRSLRDDGTGAVAAAVRAEGRRGPPLAERRADREARRNATGGGASPPGWNRLDPDQALRADGLRRTYLRDAEALEILRLDEQAQVYAVYQAALAEQGVLDFGEQIRLAIALLEERPNLALRYQRQYRHVLVDEFQDANIAQVLLLELVGRAPGGQDDVVVVGDDDQSIYRFRGASYAAFEQYRDRFSRPPPWDPDRPLRAVEARPLLLNRRSDGRILVAASRLIAHNQRRMKEELGPLRASREPGAPVEIAVLRDEAEEAEIVVERIKSAFDQLPERIELSGGRSRPKAWRDVAVLSRRHLHREAIAGALRREEIPVVVIGGTGLFVQPEVRDLEAALRTMVDPHDDVSFVRLLSAGPWRLDAAEIVRLTRAASRSGRPVFEVASDARQHLELEVERVAPIAEPGGLEAATESGPAPGRTTASGSAPRTTAAVLASEATPAPPPLSGPETRRVPLDPALATKLERLLGLLEPLVARAHRDPPYDLLETYVSGARTIHDLLAVGTAAAQKTVLAVARLLRFVADWQRDHPAGSLAEFVAHLDIFEELGGDLETEAADPGNAEGIRLTTIHQAKGLEYEVVVVPRLTAGQLPDERREEELIPVELLRQAPPEGFSLAEERRLLYVAMTRARRRLILTGIEAARPRSRFLGEISPDLGANLDDVTYDDRTQPDYLEPDVVEVATPVGEVGADSVPAVPLPRFLPFPDTHQRAYALRRRAVEIIGNLETIDAEDPVAGAARDALLEELTAVALDAAGIADDARRNGLDPLTLRVLSRHSPAGKTLLGLAALPASFSHSQFETYRRCPTRYAFERVYRIAPPVRKGFFEFGSAAHEAFEAFVTDRREARAAGLPEPGLDALRTRFEEAFSRAEFPDVITRAEYAHRSEDALRRFYDRELGTLGEVVAVEQGFLFGLDAGAGQEPVRISGYIDRIDRLPGGSLDVVDYKTGRSKAQADVDADEQLSLYALAMREGAVRDPATNEPLGTPSRLSLYFTEEALEVSTTRTDAQLDAVRDGVIALARRIRSGDFAATPGFFTCQWCDYRRICPSRYREEALV